MRQIGRVSSVRYAPHTRRSNAGVKAVLRRLARFTGFWVKYFDYFILKNESSWDGASAYYFLGRKANEVLSDRELAGLFRN